MPNGESRNWIRFIGSLEGFFAEYGAWPEKIYVYPDFIEELYQKLPPGDFERLLAKLELIPESNAAFRCEDSRGRRYDYGKQGFAKKKPKPDALEWLGISAPDYDD